MGKKRFRKERTEIFDSIERRLELVMQERTFPPEIARTFNWVLYDELEKERSIDGGGTYSLSPVFFGQYILDPLNPCQVRVYSGHGTEACSPIPIQRGIIGRAIRTGEDQYVPDVSTDPDHVACDKEMHGTEIVLLSWSEPYNIGDLRGQKIPLGVLDIDLNVHDAFSHEDMSRLTRIWRPYGKLIFPGEPSFSAPENVAKRFHNGRK